MSLPSYVISRKDGVNCWSCNKKLQADQLTIAKRRGNRGVKHYCLNCAVLKHVVTTEELAKALAMMGYKTGKREKIMMEITDYVNTITA